MADPLTASPGPTPREWRDAMGSFPSGVTIITSWRGTTPIGATANAFCSVSLDPPLLLVCLDLTNPTLGPIEQCGLFGVNMLGADDAHLAMRFGRKPEEGRFEGIAFRAADGGTPEFEAATVFIDCALAAAHEAGDHKVLVGRGLRISHNSSAPPLVYHKGAFPRSF
jgi:3-hydroxy-9,10-secoandrosta-1,3,5(10)-triene-9,17-dione monooxygenase reductase component